MSVGKDKVVRTRVAPSPTGEPHLGNFYSALLNFAVARKHNGQFVVRIEDTDRARFVAGAEEQFFEALDWLGLREDESPRRGGPFAPYRQSERLPLYQKYALELVEREAAYHDQGAIRQKIPEEGRTRFRDILRGEIVFEHENLDESVLLRSDGYPTYHLAVVVDDYLMKISHVIRGEDWIPSTPKHILLYKALGWEPPIFIHTPLLRNPDQSKLSKRKNPTSVLWYRDQGFLPEALVNYLTHLGWTHPQEKEMYSFDEFLERFEIAAIKARAPVFDLGKLRWLNGKYLRSLGVGELMLKLKAQNSKLENVDDEYLRKIIPLVKERMKTLKEFGQLTRFFFTEPDVDPKILVQKGRTQKETAAALKYLSTRLTSLSSKDWNAAELEQICRNFAEENKGWNTKDLFMTLRVALTGETATPPLFETMEVLGPKRTLTRLSSAANQLSNLG